MKEKTKYFPRKKESLTDMYYSPLISGQNYSFFKIKKETAYP